MNYAKALRKERDGQAAIWHIIETLQCNKVLGVGDINDGHEYRSGLILDPLCGRNRFTGCDETVARKKETNSVAENTCSVAFCL